MIAAAGSVALKTRKGRTATVRPLTNLLTSNDEGNGISAYRRQCLRRYGVTGSRADAIAGIAWGTAQHG